MSQAAAKGKTMRATIVQAVANAMKVEMERDEKVLVLGEDIGKDEGVFRATEGLFDAFGPDRVMDTPIAESGIVGFSVGLAIGGFRPVAEIQFMGFVYVCVNQLMAHASRYRWRTRGRHKMSMVVRMPYGGGIHAPEHHSESYESIFAHTPGMKVVIPSTPYDAKGLLISAIRDDDPVLFLEPKRIYRAFREEIPTEAYTVPIGKAKVVKEGEDITFVAYGAMMRPTLEAAEVLKSEGIKAEVIDLRTIMPLDQDTVVESVTKTGRCVVVHEAPRFSSISSEICALINEKALLHLLAPVARVTGYDTPMPLAKSEMAYLPSSQRILKAARDTLAF
ncbi:MAG TPA: alpha-ketoacid dehydrogenase subunit beta [Myxococcales bacterium]|nr:alpha-ketoacid dehydrogenase subunit beta [Deltaproteobacteria bacterium]HAA53472.1 alpha-ketoacid dehydrogenase subunit beta [Myxococcales bacterium]|tara:strand:+ start:50454 stop:51458 length:1005 start_codon:yes stop_codon:yes gene_type:complete